ncbi:hypothetical protein C8A05DRAFT_31804 [Staphylotrichum tortipilum]|uniref:Uncharacterized protein n=1 Tax=Staphylotrichum tortipilum TaxID=2831512 RepID=A0AAN6MR32_9PEZI|nr:hypothetical protein C8A05DRAFT_31804 [Staphylotrichum longicolle]
MAITRHAILLAVLLASGVAGQDPSKKPKFAYPPDGSSKVFNLRDTVMVTYTAFYDTGTLYTFCEPGKGKLIYQQQAPGFKATVPVQLNFTSATPCWFNIRTGKDGIDGENSATFSLIGEERVGGSRVFGLETDPDAGTTTTTSSSSSTSVRTSSSSSSTLSSSTTSSASVTTTSTSGSTSVSSTSSLSSSTSTNSSTTESTSPPGGAGGASGGGLSTGASAGIGIGAAIGVLGVAAVGFAFWWRRWGGRQGVVQAAEMEGGGSSWPGYGEQQQQHQLQHEQQYYSYNTAPVVPKWQCGRELDAAIHTPAEIATSGHGGAGDTGRTHHEMSADGPEGPRGWAAT